MSRRQTRSTSKELQEQPKNDDSNEHSAIDESDDEATVETRPGAPIKRRSSIFSLEASQLDPPDEDDFKKFTSDEYHFSLIRNLHMADFITLLNGFCGFYSIVSCLRFTLTGKLHYVQRAHFFILLGLFFDFLDGRVARLRNKSSLMGQELDSLADLISFGVAPASIAFAIGLQSTIDVLILSFFVLCGLSRLARFNVTVTSIPKDLNGKSKYFEGFPIPTTLLLVFIMAFLVHKDLVLGNLPFGLLFPGEFWEFHPLVIAFALHGSALISKSLKIPKP